MRKKIISTLLAVVMAFTMVVPAFAADKTTITVTGSATSYEAYKLLDLTTSLKDHSGEKAAELCGQAEGPHEDTCYNYSYTYNDTFKTILQNASSAADTTGDGNNDSEVSIAELLAYLRKMEDDGEDIRTWADAVYAAIKTAGIAATASATVDGESGTFSSVDQGYYLIIEKANAADPDAYSLVMLDTAGMETVEVESKEDVPTLEKQVLEVNDSDTSKGAAAEQWQDAADYDKGDNVKFRLTGTLPENYDHYKTYKYIFHDSLDEGLELVKSSITVKVDGEALTETSDYTINESPTDAGEGCSFEIVINDLKTVSHAPGSAGSTITVEYEAKLLDSAGLKTENDAQLEFSNNPYVGGDGETDTTSKTPKDVAVVFTYKLVIDKEDQDKNPVKGANFTLYKDDGTGEYKEYKVYTATGTETQFTFDGLDAGKYKLVESTVPDGYTQAEDLYFEVVAEYVTTGDSAEDLALNKLEVKDKDGNVKSADAEGPDVLYVVELTTGSISTTVVNVTGTILPSTGGIGTVIFYVAGALLLAGGLFLVLNKKREETNA